VKQNSVQVPDAPKECTDFNVTAAYRGSRVFCGDIDRGREMRCGWEFRSRAGIRGVCGKGRGALDAVSVRVAIFRI
jgi:hypothetical protein